MVGGKMLAEHKPPLRLRLRGIGCWMSSNRNELATGNSKFGIANIMVDCSNSNIGLMKDIIHETRKVLFTESSANDEDKAVGMRKGGVAPASSSIANSVHSRGVKSRARLASSTSVLANISSNFTEKAKNNQGPLKEVTTGDNHKVLKKYGKRSNMQVDSLAVVFSNSNENASNVSVPDEQRIAKLSDTRNVSVGVPLSSSTRQRQNAPNRTIIHSIESKHDKPQADKNRNSNRQRHNATSLDSCDLARPRIKRYSGPSSLMTLPSSTQKVREPKHSLDVKQRNKQIPRRIISDGKSKCSRLPPSSTPPYLETTASIDYANVATITSDIDMLSIGDFQSTCSTPNNVQRRNRLGSIASPPEVIHRLSMLSNPLFFADHSPRQDSTSLQKRSDNKKTPLKQSLTSSALSHCTSSDLIISSCPAVSDDLDNFPDYAEKRLEETMEEALPYSETHLTEDTAKQPECNQLPPKNDNNNTATSNENDRLHSRPAKTKIKDTTSTHRLLNSHCVKKKEDEDGISVAPLNVRKSSRNSKPTDRLTVETWTKKCKSTRTVKHGPNDSEKIRKVHSPRAAGDCSVAIKDKKSIRSVDTKKNGDDVEDGADWESYQAYIQSLLTRGNKPDSN